MSKRSATLGIAMLLPLLVLPLSAAELLVCPAPDRGETAEDCPWAGVARLLDAAAAAGKPLEPVLSAHAPDLLRQLSEDKNSPALSLWGESINFDELAGGTIVSPPLMSYIASATGAPEPQGAIVHAGIEHTYGYLFSLLPTRYGFKRARWVRPDIELGLGLPRGSAGPAPSSGTLLANITCLAGGIALKDDPVAFSLLRTVLPACGAAIRDFASRTRKRQRLTEEIELPGGRNVALRTDFLPFTAEQGGNSYLLVYSVRDSAADSAYLVTAFPVGRGFVDSALAPAGLGDEKPVQTRYNAHVRGITGNGKFMGKRRVSVVKL